MAENEKEQLKRFIHQLPNAVSGDGKAFVAQLKKALSYLSEHAGGSGGSEDSGEGEDAINQVTALRLTEVHTVDSSGFPKNNIEVTFDNSNIENYAFAQIWVKDDTENTYQQHGNTTGTRYLFENALVGRTYTVKVVVQLKDGRTSDFDNAPTASILIQGSVLIPDAPTQFFLTWDEDGALWQWQYEENEYIDFFELRLDANAGVYNDKLLDRTRLSYSRVSPDVRSGTAYLFIRNVFGDYSTPATHVFNKPVGTKPNKPVMQATLDGVVITMSPLPTGYQGYVLEIDGEEFKTLNRQFVYYKFSGTVKARYCIYDEIGRGEWSEYESITIKVVLDPDELPEITYDAFDQTIKDAIDAANNQAEINEQIKSDIEGAKLDVQTVSNKVDQNTASIELANDNITSVVSKLNGSAQDSGYEALTGLASSIVQTSDSITSVVTELNKDAKNCSYSAITQLKDGIDLSVKNEDLTGKEIISRINISPEVITIDGKYVHVTGDTVFDNDVIVGDTIKADTINTDHLQTNAVTTAKIATNAITTDKISANSITTEKITDKSITSVKIEDGAITTTKIVDGAVSSTKIEGGAITTEHIQVGSVIGEHISAGAVTTEKIAAGAITAQQLAAGAITAETLGVDKLSAISAVIGELKTADSGARMVIKDNLIEIYDENDMLRVRMGVWG